MPNATAPRHPIRVVAQRTGLTPATLRAWERRYQVVEPTRSDGGQRLYSDADVERLVRLRRLSDAGRPISLVASLKDEEAEALLREDQAQRPGGASPTPSAGEAAARMVEAAYTQVLALDGDALEALLRRSAVTLGAYPFLEEVVAVLLHRVGRAWTEGELGPAHEHLCTGVVEGVLSWLADPSAAESGSPRVVVATLPEERHGLGARLVAAAAGLEGWQVTHLGVDLPARDIADAARAVSARVVAVSVVNADTLAAVEVGLAELRGALPHGTAILVGGGAAGRLHARALPAGTEVVQGMRDLRQALERLR
ncbi:MAG TPA: MerR family transcriptional regulator [Longimicrobiales bacterium]|nr:MerR family transcriptional regulator [Longimicrobiales bacterium]